MIRLSSSGSSRICALPPRGRVPARAHPSAPSPYRDLATLTAAPRDQARRLGHTSEKGSYVTFPGTARASPPGPPNLTPLMLLTLRRIVAPLAGSRRG